MAVTPKKYIRLLQLFQKQGGLLKFSEKYGIQRKELSYLVENKVVEKIDEENYRLTPYKNFSTLPSPYSELKAPLPLEIHSFFREENGIYLEKIIKERKVKTIVELGSWFGKSTLHMAALLPKGGKLYAIDHWLGSKEHRENPKWSHHLLFVYEQFLSNVIHAKLVDTIIPMKMKTVEAAKIFKEQVDLVYVDASHEEEDVYQDLKEWYPFIEKGGILCGDDWSWGEKNGYPVQKAVIKFCKEKMLPYATDGCFWRTSETILSHLSATL